MTRAEIVVAIICIALNLGESDQSLENDYCSTSECVIAASKMHTAIEPSGNACDDFNKFVCGNYIKNTVLHDRFSDHEYLVDTKEKELFRLKKLLERKPEKKDLRAFLLLKSFYETCVDHDQLTELGSKPLLEILNNLGGFPLLTSDWTEADWQIINNKLVQAGFTKNFLIDVLVEADHRESTKYILEITPPSENILYSYYNYLQHGLANEKVQAYYDYMVDFSIYLGAEENAAKIQMLDVLQFEVELCKLKLLDDSDSRNYFTINELNQKFSFLNWTEFLEVQLGNSVKLDEETVVVVRKLKFFESLGDVLMKTPAKTMANYLFWRSADLVKSYLAQHVSEAGLKFYGKVFGIFRLEQRWKRCLGFAKRLFSVAFSALNARNTEIRTNEDTDLIIKLVKDETLKYVSSLKASEEKKSVLLRRISSTKVLSGAPGEFLNDEVVDEYYKDAEIIDGDFFTNILKMEYFVKRKIGQRLFKPVAENLWNSHVDNYFDTTYYSLDKKFIFLGSSEFLSPYYDPELPQYIRFAGIGYEVANYFAFALENEAKDLHLQYFEAKTKCFQNQYEQYVNENFEISINGSKASLQNTADFLSYYLSYKAYRTWHDSWHNSTSAIVQRLPGLFYTPEQFFWISSSQRLCSIDRDVGVIKRKVLSAYPINSFRIINSLRNNEDFVKDFNCPFGSVMNIGTKC